MQHISIAQRAANGEFKFSDLSDAAQVVLRLLALHNETDKAQLAQRAERKGIGMHSSSRAADYLIDNGLAGRVKCGASYRLTASGLELVRAAPAAPEPAPRVRRIGPMKSAQYLAPELGRTCNRAGAYTAFALPSLSQVTA